MVLVARIVVAGITLFLLIIIIIIIFIIITIVVVAAATAAAVIIVQKETETCIWSHWPPKHPQRASSGI